MQHTQCMALRHARCTHTDVGCSTSELNSIKACQDNITSPNFNDVTAICNYHETLFRCYPKCFCTRNNMAPVLQNYEDTMTRFGCRVFVHCGCDGVANSGKLIDGCGDCDGGGRRCSPCPGGRQLEPGKCDCNGRVRDACGVCGGTALTCHDSQTTTTPAPPTTAPASIVTSPPNVASTTPAPALGHCSSAVCACVCACVCVCVCVCALQCRKRFTSRHQSCHRRAL